MHDSRITRRFVADRYHSNPSFGGVLVSGNGQSDFTRSWHHDQARSGLVLHDHSDAGRYARTI